MSEQEPTKACIRVLKTESIVRYYIWHTLDIMITKFVDCIVWVFNLVNWCIARALARWFGLPLLIYWLYWFLNSSEYNMDNMSFEFFGTNMILMAILGCFILVSWFEVPYKERKILNSYSDYKEQNK